MKLIFVILILFSNTFILLTPKFDNYNFVNLIIKESVCTINATNYENIRKYFNIETPYLSNEFLEFIKQSLIFYKINHLISLEIFVSLIFVESEFKPNACSKKNAYGLTQILASTEKIINKEIYKNDTHYLDRYDPFDNVTLSILYLKDLLKRFNSNIEYALRFYNGGNNFQQIKATKNYYQKIITLANYLSYLVYH